jgi:hypothetical protein
MAPPTLTLAFDARPHLLAGERGFMGWPAPSAAPL